jgi:hypothetical protein
VILERNVDFPTEGKPTSAIRASPDLETSKPAPPPPPAPGTGLEELSSIAGEFSNEIVSERTAGWGLRAYPFRRPR